MKPIGGYFELALPNNSDSNVIHNNALKVNNARNALELIILEYKISKIYIPRYFCEVLMQPILRQKIDYSFYSINQELMPEKIELGSEEYILVINYFGLLSKELKHFNSEYERIIIDNSQALFSLPIDNVPTFYSPRKFFGLPDGGFLYDNHISVSELPNDTSFDRVTHLIKRIDISAESGFSDFQENESRLNGLPLRQISKLTAKLYVNCDFEHARYQRNSNFSYLHSKLSKYNKLKRFIDDKMINGALTYPLLGDNFNKLRAFLIANKIFIPQYWASAKKYCDQDSWENYLIDNLVALPIDHRYNLSEMAIIVQLVEDFFSE